MVARLVKSSHDDSGVAQEIHGAAVSKKRWKKSALRTSTFVKVRFSSLNSKTEQNISLNF
jgi:hypothetical protein